MGRKYTPIFLAVLLSTQLTGQTVFEEDFENKVTGLDLTTEGYQLSLGSSYEGSLTAVVAENDSNKFARMVASPNGAAKMQMVLSIELEPGKIYTYEADSRGPFKRQLRVYSQGDEILGTSSDYKPATDPEQVQWKKQEVTFMPAAGENKVKIGIYHYWSGTLDLDNFKVYETTKQSAYFLSSSRGDDNNPGTIDEPWLSLEKISSATLFPGDSVLFKRGDQFFGHFVVSGSGSEELPVLISTYGEGDLPLISGQVGTEGGGDYEEAILLENNDNLVFDRLEIQNERLVSRPGVNDTDAYGVQVKNSGTGVMRNLVFRHMVFKNVFAVQPILDPEDFNSIHVSGLSFTSAKNTDPGKESHIRDILVEDCYFANLQRIGIKFHHSGGNTGVGNDSLNRNMNIVCRNNEFYYNGGTAILPASTYNCLIENNLFDHPGASTDPRMPGRGSSVWNINSYHTIIQYNMCLSTRGYLDSYGIHIDNNNVNTFIQYNYMEDCEGGFVEILKGNKNAVYRFNVSVNDGWRVHPTWKDSNMTIWMSSARWSNEDGNLELSDSCFVYNNTVVIDRPFTSSINMDAKNIFVYNNIFSSTNGSGMGSQNTVVRSNETPFFMSNNLFEGTVDNRFVAMDAMPQKGSPMFVDTGDNKLAYQVSPGSPAIDNGAPVRGPFVVGAGKGVFKNVPAYPTVDFLGNPIDLSSGTPNIGACNVKNPDDTTETGHGIPAYGSSFLVYPHLADSRIHIIHKGRLSGMVDISIFNLKGQLILTERKNIHPNENEFDLKLRSPVPNGIYILNIHGNGASYSKRIVLYQ